MYEFAYEFCYTSTMRNPKHRLKLYRRHIEGCKAKSDLACHCPLWVYGHIHGKPIRQSLETRDITTGQRRVEVMLAHTPATGDSPSGQSLEDAIALFLAEARSRKRAAGTIELYEIKLRKIAAYLRQHGIANVNEIKTEHLTRLIHSDLLAKDHTKNSWLDVLKNWLNFCVRQEWIENSPASKERMRRLAVKGFRRTALTQQEVARVRKVIETFKEPQRRNMRALFLILIYTGLRISDVLALERTNINWKTGHLGPITIIKGDDKEYEAALHADVIHALRQLPNEGPKFFYNGLDLRAAYKRSHADVVATLKPILKKQVTPHWLRDTFAVNLLEQGADIYDVSLLLGHSSVEITQRRYVSRTPKERIAAALAKLQYSGPAKLKRVS